MGRNAATTSDTTKAQLERAARDAEAMEYRKAGMSLQAIADQMGVKQTTTVTQMIRRALRRQYFETTDEFREMEMSRYDTIIQGLWVRAARGELAAIDRVLKVMAQRAQLLGLNAPLKVDWRMMVQMTANEMGLSESEKKELTQEVQLYIAAQSVTTT